MHARLARTVALALPLLLVACGEDPVSTSQPVGINLDVKGEDKITTVNVDKGITTESGNPYGAFVDAAKRDLGKDPSKIDVESVELLLGSKVTGVTKLEDIFGGQVDVLFLMNDTNNTYPVAHAESVTGTGPIDMTIDWDPESVSEADFAKLLGGSFKVVLRAPAAASFQVKGPSATLQATFKMTAFE